MKAVYGFLWVVVILGYGLYLTRRDRRSGRVQSGGRPWLDNLLLLLSGIVLAGVMGVAIWLLGPGATRQGSMGRVAFEVAFIGVAAGVTYCASLLLRRKKGKKH